MFSYEIMDSGHSISFKLFYGLKADKELEILSDVFKGQTGHINYNADNSGYFTYCVQQAAKQGTPTVCSSMLVLYT